MYRKIIKTILVLSLAANGFSQEAKTEEKSIKGDHRITVGLGHTHLANGKTEDGSKGWVAVPSWSLNYDYWISNKWAIGLQTDLVLEKFIIEKDNGQELEREKPFAIVPVGVFKPYKHFSFIAGAGIELAKEENLGLTRLGAEYGCELPKKWEAGVGLVWDAKWGHYDSWTLEFSFSKSF